MDPDARTEERIRILSDPSNRELLSVLEDAEGPLEVSELADRLVARGATIVGTAEYEEQLERTVVSLHHARLPKLADAGLVEYDRRTNRAAYSDPEAPGLEWHSLEEIDELVRHLTAGDDADDGAVGVIRGRESVIECGRRLADGAEEELFCMYVDTELLEDECVRRAREALDRGVTIRLGSRNPEVRELTREHLPEATLWEPQLDLTNASTYPRVGRLVLVDRRAVMLAVLDEPASGGEHPDETAVVAEGADHPLVVLVRELLGSRLDHLDYQSENFRRELPS